MAQDCDEWKGFLEKVKTQMSCGVSYDNQVLYIGK